MKVQVRLRSGIQLKFSLQDDTELDLLLDTLNGGDLYPATIFGSSAVTYFNKYAVDSLTVREKEDDNEVLRAMSPDSFTTEKVADE